ncbi:MAG: hypothetical protein WCK43_09645, partial [bacterium]|jgi:hypothetical protein
MKTSKTHKVEMLLLEERPESSKHPQGNRVLTCTEFNTKYLKILGRPRFEIFDATLSIPQNGKQIKASLRVLEKKQDYFLAEMIEPSTELITELSWWDYSEQPAALPSTDQNVGIDA